MKCFDEKKVVMRYSSLSNGTSSLMVSNTSLLNDSDMDVSSKNVAMVDSYGCSTHAMPYVDLTQLSAVHMALIMVYNIIILFAIFGNLLVIWTIWRNPHMQTVTNYYIVNLALSDLLVSVFCMPFKLMEYATPCQWGIFSSDILCAVLSYVLPIFVFTSIFTLVAISIERYYAIVHPLSAMKVNSKSRTKKIIAATWIIPIIVCTPYLYCESVSATVRSEFGTISRQYCSDKFNNIDGDTGIFRRCFFILLFIAMYFVPMFIIIVTCTRIAYSLIQPIMVEQLPQGNRENKRRSEMNKRKVARMVIVVAVAFILAWSPQFSISLISQIQSPSFLVKSNFFFTMLMTHLFGFINSCVNPIIYTAMSEKFRSSFRRTLNRLFCNIFNCRQQNLTGLNTLRSKSTTMTSASRSYIEPEEEPLQHSRNGKLKPINHRVDSGNEYGSSIELGKEG